MSTNSSDTQLAEMIGSIKTAHEALEWCSHLFRTIYEKSKFELQDSTNNLMLKLVEIQKSSGIGLHLATEFESLIRNHLAAVHQKTGRDA
jgi:hypothetical protein